MEEFSIRATLSPEETRAIIERLKSNEKKDFADLCALYASNIWVDAGVGSYAEFLGIEVGWDSAHAGRVARACVARVDHGVEIITVPEHRAMVEGHGFARSTSPSPLDLKAILELALVQYEGRRPSAREIRDVATAYWDKRTRDEAALSDAQRELGRAEIDRQFRESISTVPGLGVEPDFEPVIAHETPRNADRMQPPEELTREQKTILHQFRLIRDRIVSIAKDRPDAIPPAVAESLIQRIMESADMLRDAMPHAPCPKCVERTGKCPVPTEQRNTNCLLCHGRSWVTRVAWDATPEESKIRTLKTGV